MTERLNRSFYIRDVLDVAPALLGKVLVVKNSMHDLRFGITEVEAYKGFNDLACHASKGRTNRTRIMFASGGHVYMYLIYGIHWMFNIVTGAVENPQAVLVRGISGVSGPGRVGKTLGLNSSFYGEDLCTSDRIWIEDAPLPKQLNATPRIGIDYAGEPWVSKNWRWVCPF